MFHRMQVNSAFTVWLVSDVCFQINMFLFWCFSVYKCICLCLGVSVFTTWQQVQTWQAAGIPADLSDDAASTSSATLQSTAGTILQCTACRSHIKWSGRHGGVGENFAACWGYPYWSVRRKRWFGKSDRCSAQFIAESLYYKTQLPSWQRICSWNVQETATHPKLSPSSSDLRLESADDWASEAIVSKLSAVTVRKGDPDFTDRFNETWNKQKLSLLERCVLLRMWDY